MASPARTFSLFVCAGCVLFAAADARAHCDTLSGPVVAAARISLASGDITPSLIWVRKSEEAEVRQAFLQTLTVRRYGEPARDLADRYFFETLVRLHRLGEGEPYTGLKEDGEPNPAIDAADVALETGNVDPLLHLLTDATASGLRARFALARSSALERKKSLEAGREYVAAYVSFIHYVEALYATAADTSTSHAEKPSDNRGRHD